jgi:hypothetical protein
MTPEEEREIYGKRIEHLQMLIGAAKQRGDMKAVLQLEQELIEATDAYNATQ